MVGTLDDAARVLDMPRAEMLRLAASSNVFDMRRLGAVMAGSGKRLLALAKERAGVPNLAAERVPSVELPSAFERRGRLVIELSESGVALTAAVKRGASAIRDTAVRWTITDGTAHPDSVVETVLDSFWPPRDAVAPSSPFMTWCTDCRQRAEPGDPPTLEEIIFSEQYLVLYHTARGYGHVLELRSKKNVKNPKGKAVTSSSSVSTSKPSLYGDLAAVLFCLPPTVTGKVGTPEYYHGIARANLQTPKLPAPELAVREMALAGLVDERRPAAPHWYVLILATRPEFRGQGCARKLLNVVEEWARRDRVFCYLETDGWTGRIYERMGWRMVWSEELQVSENEKALSVVGLVAGETAGLVAGEQERGDQRTTLR